jgi:hypothetical protein
MPEHFQSQLVSKKTHFDCGEEVQIALTWEFEVPQSHFEIRFVWSTHGKGDQDLQVVKKLKILAPGTSGQELVTTKLPSSPYSFSGKLISLVWGIEVIAFPSRENVRFDIVIGPNAQEVSLWFSENTQKIRSNVGQDDDDLNDS